MAENQKHALTLHVTASQRVTTLQLVHVFLSERGGPRPGTEQRVCPVSCALGLSGGFPASGVGRQGPRHGQRRESQETASASGISVLANSFQRDSS